MRPILQLAVAAAVIGAATASAFAMYRTECTFGNTTYATCTHSWSMTGLGGSRSAYRVLGGYSYFGDPYECEVDLQMTKPVMGNSTFTLAFSQPLKRVTETRYLCQNNSAARNTNSTVAASLISECEYVVDTCSAQERLAESDLAQKRRRRFRAIPGKVDLDKVIAACSARVYKSFTTYDGTVVRKYFGQVLDGETTRKVRGKIVFKFRRAPRLLT